LNAIRGQNDAKKRLRLSCDRLVEWQLGLCLQQKWLKGGGVGRKSYQVSNKIALVSAYEYVPSNARKLEVMI